MLHIEPSTLIFQIINFFILLVILTRFLYQPLLRTMQARETEITARLQDADERARLADAERARLAEQAQQASAVAEAQRTQLIAAANREREQIVARARDDAAHLLNEAHRRAEEQDELARSELATLARGAAVTIAAQLIGRAAGLQVHQAMLDRLLGGNLELTPRQVEALTRELERVRGHITVELAYPAPPDLEARCRAALAAALPAYTGAIEVTVQVEPSLVAGPRLLVGTVAIDLSLRHTLDELTTSPTVAGQEAA